MLSFVGFPEGVDPVPAVGIGSPSGIPPLAPGAKPLALPAGLWFSLSGQQAE